MLWPRIFPRSPSTEITVYVHPDHQGHGVARALYRRLIPTLEAQGYRSLLAGITIPNPPSVRLHESFGFRRVACLERVGWKFDRWHDVGYWEALPGDQMLAAARPPRVEVHQDRYRDQVPEQAVLPRVGAGGGDRPQPDTEEADHQQPDVDGAVGRAPRAVSALGR